MKNQVCMLQSTLGRQMMSFIITTSSGGVILVDGGYESDVEKLLSFLRKTTKSEKPHIDAVWLTHPHTDHIWAFVSLIKNHRNEFSFDKLYYHFNTEEFLKNDPDVWLLKEFNSLLPSIEKKTVVVQEGDIYNIKGAVFNVLYTTDSTFTNDVCNNSSTVFKMTLNGKSLMFLGDAGALAGDKLVKIYGKSLESDYVQMAHHGQSGADKNLYEAVKPKIGCFWTTPLWLWNNDDGKGYNTHTWKTIEVRNWMDEISPNRIDYIDKDGDQIVDF